MSQLFPSRRRAVALAVVIALVAALVFAAGTTAGQSGVTVEINEVAPEEVQVDEMVTVEYTVDGDGITDEDVSLVFEHPRGDEVTVEGQSGVNITQEVDIEPFEVDPGPYDLRIEVEGGPTAERSEALDVSPLFDPDDGAFGTTESSTDGVVATYEGTAGDFVTVDVSLNDMEEAYVIVGGDRAIEGDQTDAPLDVLHVDGSATFVVNTRLVGTDRSSEQVYIPIDGEVTSYAHDLGPDAEPSGVFEGLVFENEEYDQVAETLSEFRAAVNAGIQIRPLQSSDVSMVIAGSESIVVTEDELPDARFPLDRANIALTEPELDAVTTYQLPTGNADDRSFEFDPADIDDLEPGDIDGLLDDATETETIAREDRLLIEVEATGMYGALLDSIDGSERIVDGEPALIESEEFGALLDRPEGIEMDVTHQNPGENTPKTIVELFESPRHEVSIIVDPAFGERPTAISRFYVLVDTREPAPFDPELRGGDEYDIRVSYTPPASEPYRFAEAGVGTLPDPFTPEQHAGESGTYPYLWPGDPVAEQTATVAVEKPTVEYDRTTTEGEPVVPTESDAEISGTTTIAPGTDLPVNIIIDVRDDPTTVEIEGVDIDENGTFSVEADLSMLEPEDEVDIEFWAYQNRLDERQLTVVDADDVGGFYEVTELTAESVVTVEDTFVELTAIIENTGLLPDNQTVDLVLDNEVVANESLELDAGESRALHFDDTLDDLEPGEYPLEVRTDDDFAGQLLIVEAADGVFEVTDIAAEPTVDGEEPAIDFEATVENVGPLNDTAPVELLLDDEVVGEREADLLSGQEIIYTFEDDFTTFEPGNYTLTVRTPDDEASANVTLDEPAAQLSITEVDVQTTAAQGERLEPTVVIANTGDIPDSGTVTAEFDGELVDEALVDLAPGENESVALDELALDGEPGEYTLLVETPDDEQSVTVLVEDPEEGTNDGESDESGTGGGSDETDGDGGVATALGPGRSAAIGGTAIVAAVHVLGYWV